MKTTVEPLEGNKIKLSVEVDEQEFEKALDAAFRKIARDVRIPGFRPGKAPRRLLEARIGSDVARQEALRDALPEYYVQAVKEQELDPIAPPEIDITAGSESGPIAFDAVVEVRPQVSIPGYQGLQVTVPSPHPTDEEIDRQLDRLRGQFGELQVVERPARDGDFLTIDIKGERGGEAQPALSADDYLYELGSEAVVPELDAELRGTKAGHIVTFTAKDPVGDEGDTISFTVLVKEVKEKLLPELTDEWASEASEFETVDELVADLRTRIGAVKRMQSLLALRDQALRALTDLVTDEAPDPLVNQEMERRLHEVAHRLQAQNATLEQYLEATGQSQEQFVDELRRGAAEAVKADLALRALADAQSVEVTDDDLDAEINRLAERFGQKPAQLRRELERGEQIPAVRSDLRKAKALQWLVDNVSVVDEEGNRIDRADLQPEASAAQVEDEDEVEEESAE